MSKPSEGWTPPDWTPPALHAKAPVPLSKVMLLQWLRFHGLTTLDDRTPMFVIWQAVEAAYAPAVVPNTGGGPMPATWDIWAFVAAQEKRIRGGQMSLLEVSE